MNIGGGPGGIKPPSSQPAAADKDRQDAIADIRKATTNKLEEVRTEKAQISDEFKGKAQSNRFASDKGEAARVRERFRQEFAPDTVKLVEERFGVKLDPETCFKLKQKLQGDAQGQSMLEDLKIALEQSAREVLKNLKADGSDGRPGKELKLIDIDRANAPIARPPPERPLDRPEAKTNQEAKAKEGDKTDEAAKPEATTKPRDKKTEEAPKEAAKETPKEPVKESPKEDQLAAGARQEREGRGSDASRLEGQLEDSDASIESSDAFLETSADAPPSPADGGAEVGDGDEGSDEIGRYAAALSEEGTYPDAHWSSDSGALGPASIQASMSFSAYLQLVDNREVPEQCEVILAAAVKDLDNDLKMAKHNLQLRHKLSEAMRGHARDLHKLLEGVGKNEKQMFQRLRFEIGYDAAGHEVVKTYPDTQSFTGKYEDHGFMKGETRAEESFKNLHGKEGIEEAQQNGTWQNKGDTVVGSTSFMYCDQAAIGTEMDFIGSKRQELKQEAQKHVVQIQKLMTLRKNLLEQFSKIAQSRADTWDQSLASMAR